jgi:c(7)-type cytochrome triheme protein
MHRIRFGSVALGVILMLLTGAPGGAQQKLPEPFQFPQGKDSPGPVTFDHSKHKAAGADKCTACHVKVFKMKKGQTGPLTMDKMKAGEQCGVCHDGHTKVGDTTVFTVADKANCEKCHKK